MIVINASLIGACFGDLLFVVYDLGATCGCWFDCTVVLLVLVTKLWVLLQLLVVI